MFELLALVPVDIFEKLKRIGNDSDISNRDLFKKSFK
jgi:hypothetical protein